LPAAAGCLNAAAFLLLAAFCEPAPASEISALPATATARVDTVTDTLALGLEDGRTVRLAGVELPLPPLGRPLDADWPPTREAKRALAALAVGHALTLRGTIETDRHGRLVAQAETADGDWLEGALLAKGLARVQTAPLHREAARAMLALEAEARRSRLGLWRYGVYAVRSPGDLDHAGGMFELVEGRLALPEDRRTSVTLHLEGSDATIRLDKDVADPAALIGRPLRLRGWVRWFGHPEIEITHQEQIEFLAPPG
jgi:endonuclease YncB( thermonuclease family)